ncbi:spindle assembly abnormal protein 6 homolog [Pollicipes pollicipes]|uniref:spindle assembly abnormal protein 6 homolog n=1 Tax=Pollicipes pollicipes TaxID=41117 RepID=UPI0018857B71|nr:spindle assembly abnormal protein 6 homolog [Pollicipes pollicipes]
MLKVSLTCDDDPFFHFLLTLREDSFSLLRSAQGLLVDFAQFPRKFTELVEQCVSAAAGAESPRFCLHLDTAGHDREALLEVVEVNPFRQLSHIALKLAAASDADLRQYLAGSIKALKEDLQRERARQASTEQSHTSQLRHTQELLAQRSSQLEQLRCRQLTETKYKQEVHCRELESQLRALETEHRQLKQEAVGLRKQNASLDEEYHGKSKSVQQLRTRVAVLETEERLEDQVAELQATLTRREKTVKTVSQDLLKANDIIRKLQTELAELRDKLEAAQKLHKTNENVINWLNKQLNELQSQPRRPPVAAFYQTQHGSLSAPSGENAPVAAFYQTQHGSLSAPSGENAPVAAFYQTQHGSLSVPSGENAPAVTYQTQHGSLSAPSGENAPVVAFYQTQHGSLSLPSDNA